MRGSLSTGCSRLPMASLLVSHLSFRLARLRRDIGAGAGTTGRCCAGAWAGAGASAATAAGTGAVGAGGAGGAGSGGGSGADGCGPPR